MSVVPKATKRATTLTLRNLHIDSSLTLNRVRTRFSNSKFNLTKQLIWLSQEMALNNPQHFYFDPEYYIPMR